MEGVNVRVVAEGGQVTLPLTPWGRRTWPAYRSCRAGRKQRLSAEQFRREAGRFSAETFLRFLSEFEQRSEGGGPEGNRHRRQCQAPPRLEGTICGAFRSGLPAAVQSRNWTRSSGRGSSC